MFFIIGKQEHITFDEIKISDLHGISNTTNARSFKKAATQNADINNLRAKVTFLYIALMVFRFAIVSAYVLYDSNTLDFVGEWTICLTLSFVFGVLFGILLGYLKVELSFRSVIKFSRANGASDNNLIVLGEGGINRTFSDGRSSYIVTSLVTDVYETNEFFIIKLGKYSMMIFEKNKMVPETMSELRNSLSSYSDTNILVKKMQNF